MLYYVMSNKGHRQLVFCGYMFNYERSRAGRKYWACAGKYMHKCSVRLMTSLDDTFLYSNVQDHDHLPPTSRLQKKQLYHVGRKNFVRKRQDDEKKFCTTFE